jgi:flagellar L-ring protein precursor FlgH
MPCLTRAVPALGLAALAACAPLSEVGRAPALTPTVGTEAHRAMATPPFPATAPQPGPGGATSLWNAGLGSLARPLVGDRRAHQRGDILTVVIEIDERAEVSSSSERERSGRERMGIPALFGLPQRPGAVPLDPAVDLSSQSRFEGKGNTRRREKLTLRIAATVMEVLPNGILRIEGSQEVRVNHELRELIVTGYVRPEDISRLNEITYDRIAAARIAYGGRGQISSAQAPRYGQQVADILLPF